LNITSKTTDHPNPYASLVTTLLWTTVFEATTCEAEIVIRGRKHVKGEKICLLEIQFQRRRIERNVRICVISDQGTLLASVMV
jgi:hypothetical protein